MGWGGWKDGRTNLLAGALLLTVLAACENSATA